MLPKLPAQARLLLLLSMMPWAAVLGAAPAAGSPSVPIIAVAQILAEIEKAQAAKRHADVAMLTDRVLERLGAGEKLPAGVARERVALLAASAHYRTGNAGRALQLALPLVSAPTNLGSLDTDARWLVALAYGELGKFKEATEAFSKLVETPANADRASLYQAMAAQQSGQVEVAIRAYHRHLERAPRNAAWAEAAMAVIALHLDQQQFEEARRGITLLQEARTLVDNVAALNLLSLRLGDVAMAKDDPSAALAAYREVRMRDELLVLQREKERSLELQLEQLKNGSGRNASEPDAIQRLELTRARIRTAVAEIDKMGNPDAELLLRRGEAFQRRGNIWEAALIFERLAGTDGHPPRKERALAGLVGAYAESGRMEKALTAARQLVQVFPKSALAAQACFLAATRSQGDNDAQLRMAFTDLALKSAPAPDLEEPLRLMRAHSLFGAGRHEDARQAAEEYLAAFPEGRFAEEAVYLQAMAGLITGPAARALTEIGDYLKRFPAGRFVADARYRLAVAEYSLGHYTAADDLVARWLGDHPDDHAQRGEVLSLRGDILAAQARPEEAIACFRQALEHPLADEGFGYAMDELTRLLVSQGHPDEAAARWKTLAKDRPEHAFAVNAAYWIGRILGRQGKHAEAISTMAELIRGRLADPASDTVERVLLEMANVISSRARKRNAEEISRKSQSEGGEKVARDRGKMVAPLAHDGESLLLTGDLKSSPTARARVTFLQAEIASLQGDAEESVRLLSGITTSTAIEALPAGLLGRLGDLLLVENNAELAERYFVALLERFPRSAFADFGHAGLGDLALLRGDPEKALAHYGAAVEQAGARNKLKEATLGKARALLALERWDEARSTFEHVAGHRPWRGAATAESLYSLGEILLMRGDPESLAQAQAHFQRLAISYRKHDAWVAKAWLRSGEVLEKLGRRSDALATYREILRDPRLRSFPETRAAEQRAERIQNLNT